MARLEIEGVGEGDRVKTWEEMGTERGRQRWGQSEGDRRGERGEVKRETSRQRQEIMEEEGR